MVPRGGGPGFRDRGFVQAHGKNSRVTELQWDGAAVGKMEMRHIVRPQTVDVFALNNPLTRRPRPCMTTQAAALLHFLSRLAVHSTPTSSMLIACGLPTPAACAHRSSVIGKMPTLLLYRASILGGR